MEKGSLNDSTPNSPPRPPASPASARADATDAPWRNEIAARVQDHRNRTRRASAHQPTLPGMEETFSSSSVAARVAERYARLPSYREMLEAQAVAAKSTVDSSVAASTSPAAPPDPPQPGATQAHLDLTEPPAAPAVLDPEPRQPTLLHYSVSIDSLPAPRTTPAEARAEAGAPSPAAENPPGFVDPFQTALVEPAQPLPATLLTHPRELVAPRKARPRLAEGPLHDEAHASAIKAPDSITPEADTFAETEQPMANSPAGGAELRIPEDQSESAPPVPDPAAEAPPEWHAIHLDTETPMHQPEPSSSSLLNGPRLHVASLEDRALAAFVDCALTLSAFLLFSLVFAISSTSFPRGRIALIGAGLILFAMWILYQLLFFSLTDATPGMRYAKIALCTFDDENPSRSTLRGRIAALLLSALPLGLGFLWAVFDEDSLGWHDRITQTYQRSYRDDR